MQRANKTQFDTQSILNEVDLVVQKGLNEILKDYIDKYNLYHQTYIGVLNLPAVKELHLSAINVDNNERTHPEMDSYVKNECHDLNANVRSELIEVIGNITKEYMEGEIKNLEKTVLTNFQSFTSSNNLMIQKMLLHFEYMKEEIKEIRRELSERKQIVDLSNCHDNEDQPSSYKTVVIKEEKENIILNIDETEENTQEEVQDEEDQVEDEEEEDDEVEDDEELVEDEEEEDDEVEDDEVEDDEVEEEEDQVEKEEEDQVEKEEEEDQVEKEEEDQVEEEEEELVEDEEDEEEEDEEEEDEEDEEDEEEEDQVEKEEEDQVEKEKEELVEEEDQVDTEAEDEEEEDEEEEDFFEVEIGDKSYCTSNEVNGFIYELTDDGDVGEKVGVYKNSVATFFQKIKK